MSAPMDNHQLTPRESETGDIRIGINSMSSDCNDNQTGERSLTKNGAKGRTVLAATKLNDDFRVELRERLDVEVLPNPFEYTGHWTPWEVIKAVLGIAVLPVRCLLIFLLVIAAWILAKLATLCFNENEPMHAFRRCIIFPFRIICRLIMFAAGFYWVSIKGKQASKKQCSIFAIAPHSTIADAVAFFAVHGRWSGFAKKELRNVPIIGSFYSALQLIAVDRQHPDGRKMALDEFKRRAEDDHAGWPAFAIFPEGTCTNRRSLIQFKRGAFVPGLPVQPVVLRWPFHFFDPTWTSSGPNRIILALRLLTQFYNRLEVEFLPLYEPNEEEQHDADLFGRNVRKVMAKALGVPVTEHSYEDTFLSMSAKKANCKPGEVVDFEFAKVKDLLGIDLAEAKRLLRRFSVDPKVRKTGRMNPAQFAKALNLPLTSSMIDLFDLLDIEGLGFIDYKTFLIGLTFVSQNITSDEAVDVLFQALDPENSGKISQQSLEAVFHMVFRKYSRDAVTRFLRSADVNGSGEVNREEFKTFIKKNPELLVAGLEINQAYETRGRALSILKKEYMSYPSGKPLGAP